MTAAASVTPMIEERKPCSRCSGHGRLLSQVTGGHDGPRCPDCQGHGIEPRRIPQRSPDDPSAAKEMLRKLRHLGARRPIGHWADPPEVIARRDEIDAEIRRLHPEAVEIGLPPDDIADALMLSRQHVHNIIHGRTNSHTYTRSPRLRAPLPELPRSKSGKPARIDLTFLRTKSRDPAILLEKLDRAGTLRKEWLRSQTDEGYAVRQQITEAIRDLAERAHAAGMTKRQIADTLGMTRQGLHYVLSGGDQ